MQPASAGVVVAGVLTAGSGLAGYQENSPETSGPIARSSVAHLILDPTRSGGLVV